MIDTHKDVYNKVTNIKRQKRYLHIFRQKKKETYKNNLLVAGFSPFETYARQIGSFPQGLGWKYKNIFKNHHLA